MTAYASERPVFLIKKLGGLPPLVLGILPMALGLGGGSTWLTALGILLVAEGAALLAFKIIRRSQTGLP